MKTIEAATTDNNSLSSLVLHAKPRLHDVLCPASQEASDIKLLPAGRFGSARSLPVPAVAPSISDNRQAQSDRYEKLQVMRKSFGYERLQARYQDIGWLGDRKVACSLLSGSRFTFDQVPSPVHPGSLWRNSCIISRADYKAVWATPPLRETYSATNLLGEACREAVSGMACSLRCVMPGVTVKSNAKPS